MPRKLYSDTEKVVSKLRENYKNTPASKGTIYKREKQSDKQPHGPR